MPVCEHSVPVKDHCERCNTIRIFLAQAPLIERIEKLESENKMRQHTIACIDRTYDQEIHKLVQSREANSRNNKQFCERLDKVEHALKDHSHTLDHLLERLKSKDINSNLMHKETSSHKEWMDRIEKLESLVKELIGKQDFHQALTNAAICANKKPYKCPSCEGKGIIWGNYL